MFDATFSPLQFQDATRFLYSFESQKSNGLNTYIAVSEDNPTPRIVKSDDPFSDKMTFFVDLWLLK